MKRIIASVMTLVMALTLISAVALNASASTEYSIAFDFLDTTTYESSLVYCNGMKPAGDSRSYGYKGWLGSKNAEGATSVFVFDAGENNAFTSLTINYRGYSIAAGEPDGVKIYVSTFGEDDYTLGYNEYNWTLVASIINDSTAGNGINVSDPANRDPENYRSVDVTPYVIGAAKVFVRINFFRSDNIDSVASTYFALDGAVGTLLYDVPEPETTEAPVATEPETTEAPVATEPETTEAPAETEPETTEAPAATEPETDAPSVEEPATDVSAEAPIVDKAEGGCGGFVAGGVAIFALIGTALIVKKRD